MNKSEIIESCEIEKMTAQSLEACLETLEKDCAKLVHEIDVKMQASKKERHKLNIKAFRTNKEIETDQKERKMLKSCLEFSEKSDENLKTKCTCDKSKSWENSPIALRKDQR